MQSEGETWEAYHEQMFDLSKAPNGFIRWKMLSTGVNIARKLGEARDAAVASRAETRGGIPAARLHHPVVLWVPEIYHGACLGCTWLGRGRGGREDAAEEARAHVRERQGGDLPEESLENVQVWRWEEASASKEQPTCVDEEPEERT